MISFCTRRRRDDMKKLLGILTICALVASLAVPATVLAATNSTWTQENGSETWHYTDGPETELTAKLQGDTLYIQGHGAIPEYDRNHLGNRPWHNRPIRSLVIADSVTSIGAEAFSNLKTLYHVTMSASTYIESPSAFAGAAPDCTFEITGTNITSHNIGNVPYTSLDSIAAFMQYYNGTYRYRLANYYMIGWVQNSVSPKIDHLAPLDALSNYINPDYPIPNYQSVLEFLSPKPDSSMHAHIQCRQQGKAALEVFSIVLGDATYATAFNMSVSSSKGTVTKTSTPLTYVMTVPAAFQYPGRQFSLIQLGNGVVNILDDEDLNDATLTFTTDYPTAACALIYRDTIYLPDTQNLGLQQIITE